MIKKNVFSVCLILALISSVKSQQSVLEFVNPFIGSSNYGATNPAASYPRGMVSVSPFNVSGSKFLDKDQGWLSTPYVYENDFFTGFSHLNLSGVGCPDLGVIISMPISGDLETSHYKYGTKLDQMLAVPGYFKGVLPEYNIEAEATVGLRSGITRYKFQPGASHVLINLGLGLTNELGAQLKFVSDNEIEGVRQVGSFCYNKSEESYPVYFVAKVSETPQSHGIWKTPQSYQGVEAKWMGYNGKTRFYKNYKQAVIGDSIGAYFSYNFKKPTTVELRIGVSYVSIENARANLDNDQKNRSFENLKQAAAKRWEGLLNRIEIEGGDTDTKTNFYTALYHTQLHPNIISDANGDYPKMGTRELLNASSNRYSVFSLWDTYRVYHQLMTLVYPEQQLEMIKSMLSIAEESDWLPKWELNATETTTMVGDPAGLVIADSYLKGIRGFDIEKAYQYMRKSAVNYPNPLRPGLKSYLEKGYVPSDEITSGSVSVTQEYNAADFALAQLAKALGKTKDFKIFSKRATSYRSLFDSNYNLLRPKRADGSWETDFSPEQGANFKKNPGFIEGNAWQYTFMLSHDVNGLKTLFKTYDNMANKLDHVFEMNQFDMANEPDIGYPFLYNFIKGHEYKTQQRVNDLMQTYFKNTPDGLPGNDDTGTMSSWYIFASMGIYPIIPAQNNYAVFQPVFNKVTIHLNPKFYSRAKLTLERKQDGFNQILINGILIEDKFINHQKIVNY